MIDREVQVTVEMAEQGAQAELPGHLDLFGLPPGLQLRDVIEATLEPSEDLVQSATHLADPTHHLKRHPDPISCLPQYTF